MVSDVLLQCGSILFATTVYAEAPKILAGVLVLPAVAVLLQPKTEQQTAVKPPSKADANGKPTGSQDGSNVDDMDSLPIRPFVTHYRGAMMIVTCCTILSVDFPVFPRRFAKTESFGTSLMDMGVGSFVFAAGIVAARQQLKEEFGKAPPIMAARMKTAIRHSLPLVALGLIRLWSVKGLEYAEHVSEYGVHWNFFFTLALLPPFTALLQPIIRVVPSTGTLAFVIAICYELVLYLTPDLKRYIILSPRIEGDWFSQNREGVFSFVGYLAIFIAGVGIGEGILPRDAEILSPAEARAAEKDPLDEDEAWLSEVLGHQPDEQPKANDEPAPTKIKPEPWPKWAVVHLAKWSGLWFIFSVWAMWRYGPRLFVSRRMANLAYVVWVCAFNSAQLLLFCGIEWLMFPNLYKAKDRTTERLRINDATSRVLHAFNRNGLALFLLANLLTGVINMSMQTWHMGDVEAMAVLVAYIGTLCAVGLALDHYDISIKL